MLQDTPRCTTDGISLLAFVTGNANKLIETKYILSQGIPIEIDSQDLDSKLAFSQDCTPKKLTFAVSS